MRKKKIAEMYRLAEKALLRMLYTLTLVCLTAINSWGALPNSKMDYQDYYETKEFMQNLQNAHSDLVTLKTIGFSYDIPKTPTGQSPGPLAAYDILAMRIGPLGPQYLQDAGDNIPSILFVGGLHGREWLPTQSLLYLAQYLVERLHDPYSDEYALLRRVAVWIIPMVNAAGRMIDDTDEGDPEYYYSGTGKTAAGWRHSADRRGCDAATDIARNFSVDWGGANDSGCTSGGWRNHFEGLAPFSTSEATALREFVQNHWISMAVDVHAWTQLISSPWGKDSSGTDDDVAGVEMKNRAAKIWKKGLGDLAARLHARPRPSRSSLFQTLFRIWKARVKDFVDGYALATPKRFGATSGQFTAWLAGEQHIQTFILELPPMYDRLENPNAYSDSSDSGKEFRYDTADSSNAFHPSSSRVIDLTLHSFIPMAMYLIGQASAPGSATDIDVFDISGRGAFAVDTTDTDSSPGADYGILAAKIGGSGAPGAPGTIQSRPAHLVWTSSSWHVEQEAFDYLPDGYGLELHYWIQSYTEGLSNSDVELKLKWRPYDDPAAPWTVDTEYRSYELRELERVFDSFRFTLEEDRDYELTIRVGPWIRRGLFFALDEFSKNDEKVFKFTTHWYQRPYTPN